MAEEVPQDVAAAIIDRVASNQMGVDPTQAQAPKKEADEKPTETEKAVEEGSPKVESDAMDENPVLYKILMGKDADGNDEYRDLSPEQICDIKKIRGFEPQERRNEASQHGHRGGYQKWSCQRPYGHDASLSIL